LKKNKWKIVKKESVTFFFKYDESAPELLHIYARHLTTIGQALWTWFNGESIWNEKNKRFETKTKTHCIFWTWINEKDKKVMIISCFKMEN
jgi:hypothetical protein